MITHWSEISADPNDRRVRTYLRERLSDCYQGRIPSTHEFLRQFVAGANVLDIGVVAHDLNRMTSSSVWKHDIICRSARRVVGVDIIEDAVAELNRRGYDVRCVDATSDIDLGERFDRIVIGDVIEHVNAPVKLLEFARRHLSPGGKLLCTTPNPFFVMTLLQSLREGIFIPNAEHVSWIGPSMALELAHRAELQLSEYWHTQGEGKSPAKRLIVKLLSVADLRDSELFSGCYYYVFTIPSAEAA